jgi:hypothetical protein
MRKLGRWKLLWMLASGLLLMPAVYFASASLPALSDIRHEDRFYDELSAQARAQLAPPGTRASEVTMENGHVIRIRETVYLSRSTAVLKEYQDIITAKLYRERAKVFAIALASWAALCVVLYSIGWIARKAYRKSK